MSISTGSTNSRAAAAPSTRASSSSTKGGQPGPGIGIASPSPIAMSRLPVAPRSAIALHADRAAALDRREIAAHRRNLDLDLLPRLGLARQPRRVDLR